MFLLPLWHVCQGYINIELYLSLHRPGAVQVSANVCGSEWRKRRIGIRPQSKTVTIHSKLYFYGSEAIRNYNGGMVTNKIYNKSVD